MRIDRPRITVIALSILPFIVGGGLASMILGSTVFGELLSYSQQQYSFIEIAIQTVISTGLGSLVVLSLFYTIQKRGPAARRTLVALVVSPILTISFFIVGQSLLFILFKGADIIASVLSLASLGVLLMSFVFILMDSVPSYLRNFFVVFYGSVFGTFLGIVSLTASMIVLVVVVVMEDYFLTRYSPAAEAAVLIDTPGSDPFDYTRIQTSSAAVGVGDYIAFALISAHSLLFFPFYVWVMSVLLASLGIIINATIIARDDEVLPGIPLPALLALFPWIAHLLAFPLFL
ncbi:MAG: hypothetical protein ACFFE2_02925 [Candidatus Thorarchaeota archaeon]